jgi:photosystem II stability/assembly factor-like uncharacterized protein
VRRFVVALLVLTSPCLAACGGGAAKPGPAACRWHARRPDPPTTDDLTGLSAPDRTHAWAVGGIDVPVVRATADGGRTWHAQHPPGQEGLSDVSFVDATHGWAVGVHNTLLATTDGGARWVRQNPGVAQDGNLYGVRFVSRTHGWIVGSAGVLRVTDDGGRTWMPQSAGTTFDITQVGFTDATHGWIVAGDLLRTVDGGVHWTRIYSGSDVKNEPVASAVFLDARRGWESGSEEDGDSHFGVVSQTTDNGRTFDHRVFKDFDDERFGAIAFADARHGWVAGYLGDLYYTDNGGASFARRHSSDRIEAMAFRGAAHGYAVGESGTILACTG